MGESPHERSAISMDQLIALNDELVALVRAGMPLEKGLRDAGRDLGGRLGAVTAALAARMERGEGLIGAMEAEGDRFPRVYRAVVAAGFRSGRLSLALDGLASYARGYVEMRRAIGLALIYPAIVFSLAYGLLVWLVVMVVPRFVSAFATLDPKTRWAPLIWLERAGNSAIYWGPVVPALLILAILFYASTGRSAALRGGWTSGLLKRIPWVGRMLEQSQAASFSEMLALLVDQGVPLDEGIRLAADAAGDEGLRKASLSISEGLRSGQSPSDAVKPIKRFPPLVRWLLTTGRRQAEMASALRHAAETYRRRAMRQADLMRIVLPNVLLLVIAAGATLLYALTLFGPMSVLLRNLTVG